MRIVNDEARHFYEIEAYRNGRSKEELARQLRNEVTVEFFLAVYA